MATSPTQIKNKGSKTVSSTPVLLVAANANRNSLVLHNEGPSTVYLGPSNVTANPVGDTSTGGLPLHAHRTGTVGVAEDGAEYWAVCAAGQTSTVTFRET